MQRRAGLWPEAFVLVSQMGAEARVESGLASHKVIASYITAANQKTIGETHRMEGANHAG